MLLEENKAIVRRMIDTYNQREHFNLDWFDEFIAPNYFDHTNQVGPEGVKQLFIMGHKGFPDWHEAIEDIIAEGDKVWVRVKCTGTHTGEWNHFGVQFPPTGKKVTMMMVDIWRIVNGKLVEGSEVDDSLDFLKQLGAIEYTEKGKKLFPEDAK